MPVKLTQQSNTNAQLPYERFQQFGPENLTEAELLACKRGGIDTDPWDRHSESSEIKMHR